MKWMALLLVIGCPWVGDQAYDGRVRDVDGDRVEAVRFGGDDCDDDNPNVVDCDEDNDGSFARAFGGDDCDDNDPRVHPEAAEACDGIDNDCDGLVDGRDQIEEQQLLRFYPDSDGDGFGDASAEPELSCDPIPGFVEAQALDCDDSRGDVNPAAPELCDDIDHDCDGDPTANSSNPLAWFADEDGDGARGESLGSSCDAPTPEALTIAAPEDCDDADANAFPGNEEVFYNDVDNDCLGGSDHDADGDGFDTLASGGTDCDDAAPHGHRVFPGATEFCDDIDNDCDGTVDNDVHQFSYWLDADGDGTGNAVLPPISSCLAVVDLPGFADNDLDCDDSDAVRNLLHPEICDGKDNDCDSIVDDDDEDLDVSTWHSWYADVDADGYGRDDEVVLACAAPSGFVPAGGDCDDDLDFVNPDPFTPERCDSLDNDCDGEVDEGAVDADIFYLDSDMDGFGNGNVPVPACNADAPTISANADDCNDTDAQVFPGAVEICGDNVRQDCLPLDPGDCDGDGSIGLDAGGADCDDSDPTVSPLAPEICDGKDNDCDNAVDDNDPTVDLSTARNWYVDEDQDGSGAGMGVFSCQPPEGRVSHAGDCDDLDPAVFVGALEICDSKDNDCNGTIDDHPVDPTLWYADEDLDGFGDGADPGYASCAPTDVTDVSDNTDCDDGVASVNPAAVEVCDTVDNDCSGDADDNAVDALQFFLDNDHDDFGAASLPVLACGPSLGVVPNNDDCNDADPSVYPGAEEICYDNQRQDCLPFHLDDCDSDGFVAADRGGDDCDDGTDLVSPGANEICDGLDNDCNGHVDSADPGVDLTTTTDWYLDLDLDGFGAGSGVSSCGQPAGRVLSNTDCDDDAPTTFPGASELCDGADNDCEGGIDEAPVVDAPSFYLDQDGDGFGAGGAVTTSCEAPSSEHVSFSGDCDDGNPTTFPGSEEFCDAIDNDCNGAVDDNPTDGSTYWADADGDGFGAAGQSVQACSSGGFLVTNPDDCNDAAAEVNPDAEEICYDTVRQDCRPVDLNDCDADGAVASAFGGDDCEDQDDDVYPGQPEICDGLDNDCNGLFDEEDPGVDLATTTTWDLDADGDGFGGAVVTEACSQPAHHTLSTGDCDDHEASAYPGAPEICDGRDNDCDGFADDEDPEGPLDPERFFRDLDGDGFGSDDDGLFCSAPDSTWSSDGGDCNDDVSTISPVALELCDGGVDNDCDGLDDDDDPGGQDQRTWYANNDGDGYPVITSALAACNQPPGYAPLAANDCNDNAASVNPGAQEVCNAGIDDDCNGLADLNDSGVVDATEWYRDVDGDFYGAGQPLVACSQPPGHSGNDLDCDDQNNAVNPGTAEICDTIDNDCDGLADDDDPGVLGVTTWYVDQDQDSYGASQPVSGVSPLFACAQPAGSYVLNNLDCGDLQASVNPDALEVCDGNLDNDCNGLADANDPGLSGVPTYWPDADEDGFGDDGVLGSAQCNQPLNTVTNNADCNDSDAGVRPGATEVCNGGIDDDCDGDADDDDGSVTGTQLFYADQDGDQYASYAVSVNACVPPAGFIVDPGTENDCNDNNVAVNPGASEICNAGLDDDCDGTADSADDDVVADTFFKDQDDDGYGTTSDTVVACQPPDNSYISVSGDCEDSNALRNPGAAEICDGLDNDCDNQIDSADNDVVGHPTWYEDSDDDLFGDINNSVTQCSQPSGWILQGGDCVDSNADIRPNQIEICNDIDDDCDGHVDDDDSLVIGGSTFVADADGDGYANYATTTISCDQPAGFIPNPGTDPDCNDNNVGVNPGAQEICNQGLDDDCDGDADAADADVTASAWYADGDGDGFGDATDVLTDCQQPTGYVNNDADCNDLNPGVFPGSIEACDGVDNDCDGAVDDADSSVVGQTTYYPDSDGDNFGSDSASGTARCLPEVGEVANNTDCNDALASVSPASLEICNAGVDDNCNGVADDNDSFVFGQATYYVDADGDSFGDQHDTGALKCVGAANEVTNDFDCDDSVSGINPAALEICDGGVDNDCDLHADDDDSVVFGTLLWIPDDDADGWGVIDPARFERACDTPKSSNDPPATFVESVFGGDCDDTRSGVNPGGTEVYYDSLDNDCDAFTVDNDQDGDGTPASVAVGGGPDCDDTDPTKADREFYYDGVDNDCDPQTVDDDQDGDGSPASQALGDYSTATSDCDDTDPTVRPNKPANQKVWYDGKDDLCDQNDYDRDGDGQAVTDAFTIVPYSGAFPAGLDAYDCDDLDALVAGAAPGATFHANDDEGVRTLLSTYCGIEVQLQNGPFEGGWATHGRDYRFIGGGTSIDPAFYLVDSRRELPPFPAGHRPTLTFVDLRISGSGSGAVPFFLNSAPVDDLHLVDVDIQDPDTPPSGFIQTLGNVTVDGGQMRSDDLAPLFALPPEGGANPDRQVTFDDVEVRDLTRLLDFEGAGAVALTDVRAREGELAVIDLATSASSALITSLHFDDFREVDHALLLRGSGSFELFDLQVPRGGVDVVRGEEDARILLQDSIVKITESMGVSEGAVSMTGGRLEIDHSLISSEVGVAGVANAVHLSGPATLYSTNTVYDADSFSSAYVAGVYDGLNIDGCQNVGLADDQSGRMPAGFPTESCSGTFGFCSENSGPTVHFVDYDVRDDLEDWDLDAASGGVLDGRARAATCLGGFIGDIGPNGP